LKWFDMTEFIEDFEEETWAIRPNKSQLKRDISEVSDLCEEITHLTATQIEKLELPDVLVVAIEEAAKMPVRGARKRQLKYITSLMRSLDMEPIQAALDKMKTKSAHAARELHQSENWRDRLLSDDKQALTDLLNQFTDVDVQQVRQLIRNAKKEQTLNKPPKSSRLLFRYLRGVIEGSSDVVEDLEQDY